MDMNARRNRTPAVKRPVDSKRESWSPVRKRETLNMSLLHFCDIVLTYEGITQEELRQKSMSPLDSNGSTADSFSSESTLSCLTVEEEENGTFDISPRLFTNSRVSSASASPSSPEDHRRENIVTSDEKEDQSITCFCRKPYGGRPMIQCEECTTWIHYTCAKIRKNKVPDTFICQQCKDSKAEKRKSNRMSPPSHSLYSGVRKS